MLKGILLLTKGIIRNQVLRRKLMFWITLAALLLVFLGATFISEQWARANPWLAIGYLVVCLWLTVTILLLAIMDMLIIRAMHRAARRIIEREILRKGSKDEE